MATNGNDQSVSSEYEARGGDNGAGQGPQQSQGQFGAQLQQVDDVRAQRLDISFPK